MAVWARVLLGVFALWTLVKVPLLVTGAEKIRRHLSRAAPEITSTLRKAMIGSYGAALMNLWVATVAGGVAIAGSTPFIDTVFLIPALIVFALTVPVGIKAAFESLHNPEVADFQSRFGVGSLPFLRRSERDKERS